MGSATVGMLKPQRPKCKELGSQDGAVGEGLCTSGKFSVMGGP